MDQVWLDLRAAVRGVARYPVAALVAVVSLGGAIGAATATLTLRNTIFHNPPPLYAAPQDLSMIRTTSPERPVAPVPAALYRHWLDDGALAGSMAAAAAGRAADVRMPDRTETLQVRPATPELFRVLGVLPVLGRDATGGAGDGPAPALISHRIWQNQFGGRADVAGTPIWIDGVPHQVAGVMPARFWFSALSEPIWTVADVSALAPEAQLDVVMRRDAATSPELLQARLQAAAATYAAARPADARQIRVQVRAMAGTPIGEAIGAMPVFLIGAAVLMTLLIACTNVAILMIAQWTAREQEIAIRASIGASRFRIVRTLVAESMLVAGAGGLLGIGATYALLKVAIGLAEEGAMFAWTVDPLVFLTSAAITMTAGVLTGLVPALHETRRCHDNPLARLRSSDRVRQRWRHALVAFEVAVTVALLVVAGTLVSATQRTMNAQPGFQTRPLMQAQVHNAAGVDVPGIVDHLKSLPGVADAAAATAIPVWGGGGGVRVAVSAEGAGDVTAQRVSIGQGFFATLGVPLRAGRDFNPDERMSSSRVVVVSEVLAARLWPGQPALGRQLRMEDKAYEVVGVVAGYSSTPLLRPQPALFLPIGGEAPTRMQFLVRAHDRPAGLVNTVRRELAGRSPGDEVSGVVAIDQINQVGGQELLATMIPLAPLIAIGMLLTAAGIYGVLAFAVARRASELALRLAIGAEPAHLVRLIGGYSLRLMAIGLACGVGATFALTRLAQGSGGVFDSPGWAAFAAPMAIVLMVGALASWIPARRAIRIDPAQLLRST